MFCRVRWLTTSISVLLLVLWVPATMHCTLETVPGFSFLQWCCGGDAAPEPGHPCDEDSCSAVESGFYKIEDNPGYSAAWVVLALRTAKEWVVEPAADSLADFIPASSSPPELPRLWQFIYRTALPPRAPSLVA